MHASQIRSLTRAFALVVLAVANYAIPLRADSTCYMCATYRYPEQTIVQCTDILEIDGKQCGGGTHCQATASSCETWGLFCWEEGAPGPCSDPGPIIL